MSNEQEKIKPEKQAPPEPVKKDFSVPKTAEEPPQNPFDKSVTVKRKNESEPPKKDSGG